jgi:hypothetical protein
MTTPHIRDGMINQAQQERIVRDTLGVPRYTRVPPRATFLRAT